MPNDMTTHPVPEPVHSIGKRVAVVAGLFAVVLGTGYLFFPNLDDLPSRRQPHPDILLVTFDTLRADHCSGYGYERQTTPTLDRLAREGTRFETAYAPMATTAPSHATLLTARYPLGHGVIRNGYELRDEIDTLPARLKREGYTTAAFVSSIVLFHKFGLARGFDLYDDDFTQSQATQGRADRWEGVDVPGGKTDRRADATTDRAIAWLDDVRPARRVPLFVWVHYMDPHEPYAPPESFGDPFGIAKVEKNSLAEAIVRYDTEVAFADDQLDRLVKHFETKMGRQGLLVIVTADHGESFTEHGWRGHGVQIYEESVRVPLVIRWKQWIDGGQVARAPVGLQDLAPTILSLVGVDPLADPMGEGIDLTDMLKRPESGSPDRTMFFQRRHYDQPGMVSPIPLRELGGVTFGQGVEVAGEQFAVRSGPWKFYFAPRGQTPRELYNLANDPKETRNLAGDEPDQAKRLERMIVRWRVSHRKAYGPPRFQTVSPQDRAFLEALGYVEPDDDDDPSAGPG